MVYDVPHIIYSISAFGDQIVVSISVEVFQVECGNEVFEQVQICTSTRMINIE